MATQHLDLEEQEQLDQIKHFWKQYGNLITWLLIAVLAAYAGWNGFQYWQRSQASQASALYGEIERLAGEADPAKLERAFGDMKWLADCEQPAGCRQDRPGQDSPGLGG